MTFEPGSSYEVEANAAGASDQLIATGKATIEGGTVTVLAENGAYSPLTEYTILTAADGVTGAFEGVTSNFAFLAPTLRYGATTVQLSLARNDIDFAAIATTANRRGVATAADALGMSNPVYDAIVPLSSAQANQAFDSLSGEVHATAQGLLVQDAAYPRQAVLARIDGRSDAAARGAWMQVLGAWGDDRSDGNAAAAERTTEGLMVGADMSGNGLRFGFAGGYTRTEAQIDARASEASLSSGHLMAYAGADLGAIRLSLGGGYSWSQLKTDRRVSAGTLVDRLEAKYDGRVLQGFAEAGVPIALSSGSVEPFVGFAVIDAQTGAFAERGEAAALTGEGAGETRAFSQLGVKLRSPDTGPISVNAKFAWQHAFDSAAPSTALAFTGGDAFSVAGAPLSRDGAAIEADLDWRIGGQATVSAGYRGEIGDGGSTHGAKATLSIGF